MKKCISVLVLVALAAAGAFALDMSAGGGMLFDYSANNGAGFDYAGVTYYEGARNTSFGAFGFFDITYAEFDISIAYGSLTFVEEGFNSGFNNVDIGSVIQLGFSALGKYPFDLGAITLFPLLGFNYNMVVSYTGIPGWSLDKPGDFSQFGLLAGGGLDYSFTESVFLRAELLFQLRFASKYQDDLDDFYRNVNHQNSDTTFGMGPRIKVGVGFKI